MSEQAGSGEEGQCATPESKIAKDASAGNIERLFGKNVRFANEVLGDVELKYISYGDTWEIIGILSERNPRHFAERVIHHQLLQPKVDLKDVADWPEAILVETCRKLLDNESSIRTSFRRNAERTYFEDFQAAFVEAFREQQERMDRTARALQSQLANLNGFVAMAQKAMRFVPQLPTIPVRELQMVSKQMQAISNLTSIVRVPSVYLERHLMMEAPIAEHPMAERESSSEETAEGTIAALLNSVDPILEERRTAAWETFHGEGSERLRQAAHTMREVLRQLLDNLAAEDKVVKAKWYIRPAKAPYITRRMRVRYAIVGPENNAMSQSTLDLIESLADSVDVVYGKLSSEAHALNYLEEIEVEAVLGACESMMLLILGNKTDWQDQS